MRAHRCKHRSHCYTAMTKPSSLCASHPVSERQGAWRHGPVAAHRAASTRARPGHAWRGLVERAGVGRDAVDGLLAHLVRAQVLRVRVDLRHAEHLLDLVRQVGRLRRRQGGASARAPAAGCSALHGLRRERLRRALLQHLTCALLDERVALGSEARPERPWRRSLVLFVCACRGCAGRAHCVADVGRAAAAVVPAEVARRLLELRRLARVALGRGRGVAERRAGAPWPRQHACVAQGSAAVMRVHQARLQRPPPVRSIQH